MSLANRQIVVDHALRQIGIPPLLHSWVKNTRSVKNVV
jgi:hypothetical protein